MFFLRLFRKDILFCFAEIDLEQYGALRLDSERYGLRRKIKRGDCMKRIVVRGISEINGFNKIQSKVC